MKVILKQDVNKIGKAGEILEVSDGYGRNYLIARGLAEEGTAGKIRENEEFKKTQKVKDDKKLKLAEEAKKKISGKVVSIKVNAGEGGKLFGSITAKQVAEEIKKQYNIDVDKRKVVLDCDIKEFGTYHAEVKLFTGVSAKIDVQVSEA